MPSHLWIVVAALAVASPSFAKDAAPKGAVHSWSSGKAEPTVVPAGEPEIVPRSALSSDFPMIDTPVTVPEAPVAAKAAAREIEPAARKAEVRELAPTVDPATDTALTGTAAEDIEASPGQRTLPPMATTRPLSEPNPELDALPDVEPRELASAGTAPAVVESPSIVDVPATAQPPAAIVEEPPANDPAVRSDQPAAPKRAPLPGGGRPRGPSGAAEKAAARAYLAAMQARPDPFEVQSTRRPPSADASPAMPESGVLPPKIIDVPNANRYGAPLHRTADREMLMREFPDELVERMWLQDWTDIERAYQFGQLVDVPSDPDGRGIVLRLEGGSRIGELEDDAYKQTLLCRLTKPALGLLYRIASRMRQIEGPDFVPLEITSLVRTWDYQLRLTDVNPNADRTRDGVPPTHVLGMAFDIARTQMSFERQQLIESVFDELSQTGELAYYKEGSNNGLMHYHVMALPSAETQLARYYERDSHYREQAAVAYGERARLPEAPCVTFGSSLEPFSAICSCELPLEVSAHSPGAGWAPISR